MKRTLTVLLVLALVVSSFSGCLFVPLTSWLMSLEEPDDPIWPTGPSITLPTEPATSVLPTETVPESDAPLRRINAGMKDYLEDGYVQMIPFSEMKYERPDVDALCGMFEELTAMAENGAPASEILPAYYAASDAYLHFYTMDSLAYIRYTLDTGNTYYKDEYDALELASSDVKEKLEAFNKACASSPSRDDLEREYFGYGYFDQYEDYSVYTNEEFLALSKREAELLADYRTLLEDPQVEFEGKTWSYNDLMAEFDEIDSYSEYQRYLRALQAYYEQFNPLVAEIYIQLLQVRCQMAQVLGYESYADYCYEITYERDYTHEQGCAFLEEVRTELVPLSLEIEDTVSRPDHVAFSMSQTANALASAVHSMGGRIEEAYLFMMAYGLYDLTEAPEKFDSSYTTYLYDYEAPFLTVNAKGTTSDYITFSHEFGHFTDSYVTYDADEDLETAETFSQGMEFLSLCYTSGVLTDSQVERLIQSNLLETLDTFVFQSALASFEDLVYALPPEEMTANRINQLFRQCCIDYGVYDEDFDFYYTYFWIDITHFFEVPYYVISYVVSADTALQIFMLEREEAGAGLAAYERLLDRTGGEGLQTVMVEAGLNNPFRAGALKELAAFYREEFNVH